MSHPSLFDDLIFTAVFQPVNLCWLVGFVQKATLFSAVFFVFVFAYNFERLTKNVSQRNSELD